MVLKGEVYGPTEGMSINGSRAGSTPENEVKERSIVDETAGGDQNNTGGVSEVVQVASWLD